MTDGEDQYEPSDNDSIIQGAGSAPTDQFTTSITGRSDPWRQNNVPRTAASTAPPPPQNINQTNQSQWPTQQQLAKFFRL